MRTLFVFQVMESKNLIYLVTEYAANGELLGREISSSAKTTDLSRSSPHLRSAHSSEKIKRSESTRKISTTRLGGRIHPFKEYCKSVKKDFPWTLQTNVLSFSLSFRYIVSVERVWAEAPFSRCIDVGDLKAENLLLDSRGNIKVAGKNSISTCIEPSIPLLLRRLRFCQRFQTKYQITNVLRLSTVSFVRLLDSLSPASH